MSAAAAVGLAVLALVLVRGVEAHGGASRTLRALVMASAAAVAALALGVPAMLAALVAGVIAATPLAVRLRSVLERRTRIEAQVPRLIDHVAALLAGGRALGPALVEAAQSIEQPLAGRLEGVVARIDLGESPIDALDQAVGEEGDPGLLEFAAVIAVQARCGGDLASSLRALSARRVARQRIAAELRSATAQARLTGAVVAALPVAAGCAVELARPGTVVALLAGPGLALALAVAGIQLVALLIIVRLARTGTA